jgi:hypothetical protein
MSARRVRDVVRETAAFMRAWRVDRVEAGRIRRDERDAVRAECACDRCRALRGEPLHTGQMR